MILAHVESLFYLRGHEIYPTTICVLFIVWFAFVLATILQRTKRKR